MNSKQDKLIPLRQLLDKINAREIRSAKQGDEIWYLSPFRDESTPSFHIRVKDNIWFDLGEGKGGNIIDFVMRYKNRDVSGALSFLDEMFSLFTPSPPEPKIPKKKNVHYGQYYKLVSVKEISHQALIDYVLFRNIPLSVARLFLKEVHYVGEERKFKFGLGMLNQEGGYEIRNKIYKSLVGQKSFTYIKGKNSQCLDMFEGMFCFLSKATLNGITDIPKNDTVILHSKNLIGRFSHFLRTNEIKYKELHLFGHNDANGAGEQLIGLFRNPPFVIDVESVKLHHDFYKPFGDLNDWHKANRPLSSPQ